MEAGESSGNSQEDSEANKVRREEGEKMRERQRRREGGKESERDRKREEKEHVCMREWRRVEEGRSHHTILLFITCFVVKKVLLSYAVKSRLTTAWLLINC